MINTKTNRICFSLRPIKASLAIANFLKPNQEVDSINRLSAQQILRIVLLFLHRDSGQNFNNQKQQVTSLENGLVTRWLIEAELVTFGQHVVGGSLKQI